MSKKISIPRNSANKSAPKVDETKSAPVQTKVEAKSEIKAPVVPPVKEEKKEESKGAPVPIGDELKTAMTEALGFPTVLGSFRLCGVGMGANQRIIAEYFDPALPQGKKDRYHYLELKNDAAFGSRPEDVVYFAKIRAGQSTTQSVDKVSVKQLEEA
jgi:hypothetical protein